MSSFGFSLVQRKDVHLTRIVVIIVLVFLVINLPRVGLGVFEISRYGLSIQMGNHGWPLLPVTNSPVSPQEASLINLTKFLPLSLLSLMLNLATLDPVFVLLEGFTLRHEKSRKFASLTCGHYWQKTVDIFWKSTFFQNWLICHNNCPTFVKISAFLTQFRSKKYGHFRKRRY